MLERMRRTGPDGGFSMVEVVVALVIFGVLAGTVSVTLGTVLRKTRDQQSRALAANLATRVIDRLHAIPATQLPDGPQPAQTFTSDGRKFSLMTTTALVSEGASATTSACDSVGTLSARRISVVVTWTSMGSTQPVRQDTLRRLNVAELDLTKGTITTKVVDRSGAPASNHLVTLTPGGQSYTTDASGCAVFPGVAAGAYAVTLGTSGFVDPTGTAAPARSVTATAGTVTRDGGFRYDRAASLALTWTIVAGDTAASYPVPNGVGALLGHSAYTATGSVRSFPSCPASPGCSTPGAGAFIAGLFPSTEGYRPWAGACSDAKTSTSPSPAVLLPAAAGAAVVPVARVTIAVDKRNNPTYVPVTITHVSDSGCPGGFTTTVPTLVNGSQGKAVVGLPGGTWTFSLAGFSDPRSTNTLTLDSSAPPRAVSLQMR